MMIGWFDETENDLSTGLNRTIMETEMNSIRYKPSQYATVYDGCLEFSFAIFKTNEEPITYAESRSLNKWLTGARQHKKLVFPGEQDIYYMAICTELTDVIYNGHNGKSLIFRTDSPYGYSSPITKTIKVTDSQSLKLFGDSDDGNYYPTITIKAESDDVEIENITDGNSLKINFEQLDDKKVIVDCERMRVTDKDGKLIPVYKIGWDDTDNIYWLKLLNGQNNITVTGNCTLSITTSFPRKVGMV